VDRLLADERTSNAMPLTFSCSCPLRGRLHPACVLRLFALPPERRASHQYARAPHDAEPLRQRESSPRRCAGPSLPRVRRGREPAAKRRRVRRAEARGRAAAADSLLHGLRHAAHGLNRRLVGVAGHLRLRYEVRFRSFTAKLIGADGPLVTASRAKLVAGYCTTPAKFPAHDATT